MKYLFITVLLFFNPLVATSFDCVIEEDYIIETYFEDGLLGSSKKQKKVPISEFVCNDGSGEVFSISSRLANDPVTWEDQNEELVKWVGEEGEEQLFGYQIIPNGQIWPSLIAPISSELKKSREFLNPFLIFQSIAKVQAPDPYIQYIFDFGQAISLSVPLKVGPSFEIKSLKAIRLDRIGGHMAVSYGGLSADEKRTFVRLKVVPYDAGRSVVYRYVVHNMKDVDFPKFYDAHEFRGIEAEKERKLRFIRHE